MQKLQGGNGNTGVRPVQAIKRLALAGGGTGGHIVPGLHLLRAAQARGEAPEQVLWFTSGRSVENDVLEGLGETLPQVSVEIVRLPMEAAGGGAPPLTGTLMRSPRSVWMARQALRRHRSQVLLGLGGFMGLPSVLAARILGIPVALYEVNAVAGKATRYLGGMAKNIFHAWPSSLPNSGNTRHRMIGPVIGPEFRPAGPDAERARLRTELGFEGAAPLLVILGGSQGAGALNAFILEQMDPLLSAGWQILHQVGPGRMGPVERAGALSNPGYRAVEYVHDMHRVLAASELVLARGGASTLAEIAVVGVPTWVVPYPHHADQHQAHNARMLGDGIRVVPQERLNGELASELGRLALDRVQLGHMRRSLAGFQSLGAEELWKALGSFLAR
ncbi:MAG: UDP-N-acetylglucosamine--N-acetylmuramyl-(pentapeptide) pyrophosphoryl-undecaprenol N-acetylglucosamine transferase [Planctomycetes bacterium]|nr:UDP-N-acetylglucosamine--N-acetylmuramyl-(pentapeptide) pyrophosphoryl-undecaprenol N-acetylglucosamine transferase [Planctomycetota bacterium]